MNESEIDRLARTWISIVELIIKGRGDPDIIYKIPPHPLDNLVSEDPETAWLVIDSARHKTKDELMLANIAAGPLENLLAKHGDKFIDRFEELAKRDRDFVFLMTGVWTRGDMSPSVIARVEAIKALSLLGPKGWIKVVDGSKGSE